MIISEKKQALEKWCALKIDYIESPLSVKGLIS
jgi:hypothetical protein